MNESFSMFKKLNLLSTILLISTIGKAGDTRDFLSSNQLNQQTAIAAALGGGVGYALSKDRGGGTAATVTLGLGAVIGWGVYKWQHRKTADGAKAYVYEVHSLITNKLDNQLESIGADRTFRSLYLLKQWQDSVEKARVLREKFKTDIGYKSGFFGGDNFKSAETKIKERYCYVSISLVLTKNAQELEYDKLCCTPRVLFDELIYRLNGGYPVEK